MCTQLMRPGIGQNASCAAGDWLTSRPKGCSRPRELWFFDILMYIYMHVYIHVHECLPYLALWRLLISFPRFPVYIYMHSSAGYIYIYIYLYIHVSACSTCMLVVWQSCAV